MFYSVNIFSNILVVFTYEMNWIKWKDKLFLGRYFPKKISHEGVGNFLLYRLAHLWFIAIVPTGHCFQLDFL